MTARRTMALLHSLGIEFWLPLPFLAILFWYGGNLMAHQVMSRSYATVNQLQADTQLEMKLSVPVVLIQVEVNKGLGVSYVAVKTTDSTLSKLEFKYPETEIKSVEKMIAQELGITIASVRKLTRYKIIN
jgi:hypothetical protein